MIDKKDYMMDIGLEVHIRLKTNSKLLSGSKNHFGGEMNTHINYIDLGLPGTLPLINCAAVRHAIKLGILLNSNISMYSHMDRKHYFYPDMSKGFQITQIQHPIIRDGYLDIQNAKRVTISHAHLEEDAGKLIHTEEGTLIDYNRCGVPLIELVTTPDLHTTDEVFDFLKTLRALVRDHDISDAHMEQGGFKIDVNVSVRRKDSKVLGQRCEIKNLNSFRLITRSLNYEFDRQLEEIINNRPIQQECLSFNEDKGANNVMRAKENAADYRYIPEYDVIPIHITPEMIQEVQKDISVTRSTDKFSESTSKADQVLIKKYPKAYAYFKELCNHTSYNLAFKWVYLYLVEVFNKMNIKFTCDLVPIEVLLDLISSVNSKSIDISNVKYIIEEYIISDTSISTLLHSFNLKLCDDATILAVCRNVISQEKEAVQSYVLGSTKILGFLVGKANKLCLEKGKPDSKKILHLLQEELESIKKQINNE
jgi:aspartyl-tRNA(Asn)/glutamyl-tRNA(Gln) amidotransferase subunit B